MSLLGCKTLFVVISFLVLWSICLSSSLVHFKNCPEYLTTGTTKIFIFDRNPTVELCLEYLSRSSEILFNLFFPPFISIYLTVQYSQGLIYFLFCDRFNFFLIWLFYSFHCLSFFAFHYKSGTFSTPNSIPIS